MIFAEISPLQIFSTKYRVDPSQYIGDISPMYPDICLLGGRLKHWNSICRRLKQWKDKPIIKKSIFCRLKGTW